jgi:ribose transport system substrate-binding protein
MNRLNITLLAVENNDYQAEQVVAARTVADKLSINLQIIHTEHDAILQSQTVLNLLQTKTGLRPNGILFEPVGTPLAQAAKMAVSTGVGWVVLNRQVIDYLHELRRQFNTPAFSVTTSHNDVGRIQGEQIGRLMPRGGTALYIQGPPDNDASVRRTEGMMATKPSNVEVRMLRGVWTEKSAHQAVSMWLKLSIAKEMKLGVVAAQNDAMALGARRAFQELANEEVQQRFRTLPFIGCDGLPKSGQTAVRSGLLAATVVIPPNAGRAIEVLASSLQNGSQPAEFLLTQPHSYPDLPMLRPMI